MSFSRFEPSMLDDCRNTENSDDDSLDVPRRLVTKARLFTT